jgi:hypothetical protein
LKGYEIFSLSKLIETSTDISDWLSGFRCGRDDDVQNFLRNNAIMNEKKHLSRTYLIFKADTKELAAYFAIAVSSVNAMNISCSDKMRKKLNINKDGIMQSFLLGQLGRDDRAEKNIGKFALDSAINVIKEVNSIIRVQGCET